MNNEPNRASNSPVRFLIPEAHAHTSIKADNITTKLGRNSLLSVRTQPTTPHHHWASGHVCYIWSHKKVFWMKARDGTVKNQPNKMAMTPQHVHTIPSCLTGFWWFHPYIACFHSENFFVTCSCCFCCCCCCCFLGIVREKRGQREGRGENAWSVKYKSIELCCLQGTTKINSNAFMWKCTSERQTSLFRLDTKA